MTAADLPLVGAVLESGAQDRVFDGLLIAGPAVALVLALLGRSPVTVAIALGYVAIFAGHVLRNGLVRSRDDAN